MGAGPTCPFLFLNWTFLSPFLCLPFSFFWFYVPSNHYRFTNVPAANIVYKVQGEKNMHTSGDLM